MEPEQVLILTYVQARIAAEYSTSEKYDVDFILTTVDDLIKRKSGQVLGIYFLALHILSKAMLQSLT